MPSKKITYLLLFFLGLCTLALGQPAQLLQEADRFFQSGDYAKAFQAYSKQGVRTPLVHYKLGVCYMHSLNYKTEAFSHLFKAYQAYDAGDTSVPAEVLYYLGKAYIFEEYHKPEPGRFSKYFMAAADLLNLYTEHPQATPELVNKAKETLAWGSNLDKYREEKMMKGRMLVMQDFPLNTSMSEFPSVVTGNGRTMLITSDRSRGLGNQVFTNKVMFENNLFDYGQKVFLSRWDPYNRKWSFPEYLPFEKTYVQALSLSNNEQEMLLYMGDTPEQMDVYLTEFKGRKWSKPKLVSDKLKPEGTEIAGACFTMAGKGIVFASNRPGGYGGFDLYEIYYDENQKEWTVPRNLGPLVNSKKNELNPFMKSNNKELFFSSDRQASIGGYDIFHAKADTIGRWNDVQNMGLPVNSPYNENYFAQSANGKHAYLATDRNRRAGSFTPYMRQMGNVNTNYGGLDIIRLQEKEEREVGLTIVKGSLKVFKNGKRLPVKLNVIDYSTKEPEKFVYLDSVSSEYNIFLQPNRSYDMSIEVGGHQISGLKIDLQDTYLYEFEASLRLDSILVAGKHLADEMVVLKLQHRRISMDSIRGSRPGQDVGFDPLLMLLEQTVNHEHAEGVVELGKGMQDTYKYIDPVEQAEPDDAFTRLLENLDNSVQTVDPQKIWDLTTIMQSQGDTAEIKTMDFTKLGNPLSEWLMPFDDDKIELSRSDLNELVNVAKLMRAKPGITFNVKGHFADNQATLMMRMNLIREALEKFDVDLERVKFDAVELTSSNYSKLLNSLNLSLLYNPS